MKYVLDTNIFNRVLDGRFSLSSLPKDSHFLASDVQLEELKKTPDPIRRSALVSTFQEIGPELVPASFSWNVAGAGWGQGEWSNSDAAKNLRNDLESRKSRFNNCHDALIAEIALKHNCILATTDKNLSEVAELHGIKTHHVAT